MIEYQIEKHILYIYPQYRTQAMALAHKSTTAMPKKGSFRDISKEGESRYVISFIHSFIHAQHIYPHIQLKMHKQTLII